MRRPEVLGTLDDSLRWSTPAELDAWPGLAFPAPTPATNIAVHLRSDAEATGLSGTLNAPVIGLDCSDHGFMVRTGDWTFLADQVMVGTIPVAAFWRQWPRRLESTCWSNPVNGRPISAEKRNAIA